ncbi:MAG: DUF6165 family protein [Reyranella sp.]|nr:DUF6165 family protein [Reyranella sp.]
MELHIAVSPGELIDRITILEIKQARIRDPKKLFNVNRAYASLSKILSTEILCTPRLTELNGELKAVNEALWQAEEAVRDHERRQSFDSHFIDAARMVYLSNDRRSRLKRQIDELLGSPLIEEKFYESTQSG